MPKIVKFKNKTTNVMDFLDEVKEELKKNNSTNVLIASKLEDKDSYYILTGYAGLDMGQKQELVAHLQLDVIKDMIDETYCK